MKITDIKATTVTVPLGAPLRHAAGCHWGRFVRTIVEVETDEGITGLGEMGGGGESAEAVFRAMKGYLVGHDPARLEEMRFKIANPTASLYNNRTQILAALEFACLDIIGKKWGVPVYDILGGKLQDEIPFASYLFFRYPNPKDGSGEVRTVDQLVSHAKELKSKHGFFAHKLKGGVFDPVYELECYRALAAELGTDPRSGDSFRFDPNAAWSTEQAIWFGQQIEDINNDYLEDPVFGLHGMRRTREKVRMPLATNTVVVNFEQLAANVLDTACDVILLDTTFWGGIRQCVKAAGVCETFQLGVAVHSSGELGIQLATMLHLGAVIPNLAYAADAHYHHLTDDIIEGGLMKYENGKIRVPEGPGLGVTLDRDKVAEYAELFKRLGGYSYDKDPLRPGWTPTVPNNRWADPNDDRRPEIPFENLMKQFLVTAIYILVTAAFVAQSVFPQCDITVGKGEPATAWDGQFTQNGPGWTGGDSTFSIELPNGDTAFFFSDSYIAEDPAKPGDGSVQVNENGLRTRKPNCVPPICGPAPEVIHYVYNSVVVRSKDGKTLRTLTGPKDKFGYSTSYFKPKSTNPNHMYWLGDPIIVDVGGKKKIWMFLNEWDVARPFDKSFWIKYRGQSIAQMDAETLAIEKIVDLKNKSDEAVWGISQWLDESKGGKDLYIYGMRNERDIEGVKKSTLAMADKYKKLYIAKVDASKGLEAVADLNNWNAWDGKAFVKDLSKRKSIIPEKDSISDELTIRRLNINGKPTFVMTTFDTSVGYSDWKDLYLYSACEPQGPFTTKHHFYRTPTAGQKILPGMVGSESLQSGMSVYNPHMHPQFIENGKLLISYNSNLPFGSKPGDSIYADFYRPRFVWVPIDGLAAK